MEIWTPLVIIFSVTTALLIISFVVFRRIWLKQTRARSISINASVSIFTTAYLLIALELFFAVFLFSLMDMDLRWHPNDGFRSIGTRSTHTVTEIINIIGKTEYYLLPGILLQPGTVSNIYDSVDLLQF